MYSVSPQIQEHLDNGLSPEDIAVKLDLVILEMELSADVAENIAKEMKKGAFMATANSDTAGIAKVGDKLHIHFIQQIGVGVYQMGVENYGVEQ